MSPTNEVRVVRDSEGDLEPFRQDSPKRFAESAPPHWRALRCPSSGARLAKLRDCEVCRHSAGLAKPA